MYGGAVGRVEEFEEPALARRKLGQPPPGLARVGSLGRLGAAPCRSGARADVDGARRARDARFHRPLRTARARPAPAGGDRVRLGGCRRRGQRRRPDREAARLPGDRVRRHAREGRLAARARLRRGVRLPRHGGSRRPRRWDRRLLRQRRRGHARGCAHRHAPSRPRRRLRLDLRATTTSGRSPGRGTSS